MTGVILTLNAGSSSLKFSLFKFALDRQLHLVSGGQIEGIGTSPHFIAKGPDGALIAERRWPGAEPDYAALIEQVTGWAESHMASNKLLAVGHRVVHGGRDYDKPQRITPVLLKALDKLTPLAPLHEAHNIAPMRVILDARPDLPQVACFDTAFHHQMPVVATRYALPRKYEAEGVRRYGFHGLSYEYIAGRLRKTVPELAKGRVIIAHLGNGASLCAIQDGISIDTTMGFTALDGLMMGTRCGALDPGIILYLEQQHGMTAAAVERLLYSESGLLGVSGFSSDMRTLLASDYPDARDAVNLFVYRIAREIGALTASLNGLDGLIFTAGIGEHAAQIRAMVCARLGWLGAALDEKANARDGFLISQPESRIAIHVIPTSEETMIARHTMDTIRPA